MQMKGRVACGRIGVSDGCGAAFACILIARLGCAAKCYASQIDLDSVGAPVTRFIFWCVLFARCWPLALVALVLWPLVWLVSLPFRLIGTTFEALFALLRAILFLPARVLGYRDRRA